MHASICILLYEYGLVAYTKANNFEVMPMFIVHVLSYAPCPPASILHVSFDTIYIYIYTTIVLKLFINYDNYTV